MSIGIRAWRSNDIGFVKHFPKQIDGQKHRDGNASNFEVNVYTVSTGAGRQAGGHVRVLNVNRTGLSRVKTHMNGVNA